MNQDKKPNNKSFTTTEVGTLLEDINSKFDLLAEGQSGLREDVHGLKEEVNKLAGRMDRLEITTKFMKAAILDLSKDVKDIKVSVSSHNRRISTLEVTPRS